MTVTPPVASPTTLVEAYGLMTAGGSGPSPVAPTSWCSWRRMSPSRRQPIVDLWQLDELRGVGYDGYEVTIGALTTFTELRHSTVIRARLPALAEAAATIGAIQIQNRATIGGNVCNASPAGDSLPVLMAVDATFDLGSATGERSVSAAAALDRLSPDGAPSDELLLRMRFPVERYRRTRFRKVGTRRAQAISKVVMALSYQEDGGVWRNVRVALGSVAPTTDPGPQTEAVLEGGAPRESVADHAVAVLAGRAPSHRRRALDRGLPPIRECPSLAPTPPRGRWLVTARIVRRIGTPDRDADERDVPLMDRCPKCGAEVTSRPAVLPVLRHRARRRSCLSDVRCRPRGGRSVLRAVRHARLDGARVE